MESPTYLPNKLEAAKKYISDCNNLNMNIKKTEWIKKHPEFNISTKTLYRGLKHYNFKLNNRINNKDIKKDNNNKFINKQISNILKQTKSNNKVKTAYHMVR